MARKKKFMVVPRTKDAQLTGINTSVGNMKFRRGAAYVSESSVADEINKTQGLKGTGDVWVQEDPVYEWSLHHDGNTDGHNITIHHYTFGPSKRYAEAWDAFEKRRKDKKNAS